MLCVQNNKQQVRIFGNIWRVATEEARRTVRSELIKIIEGRCANSPWRKIPFWFSDFNRKGSRRIAFVWIPPVDASLAAAVREVMRRADGRDASKEPWAGEMMLLAIHEWYRDQRGAAARQFLRGCKIVKHLRVCSREAS